MICFHEDFKITIRFHEGHRCFVAVASNGPINYEVAAKDEASAKQAIIDTLSLRPR